MDKKQSELSFWEEMKLYENVGDQLRCSDCPMSHRDMSDGGMTPLSECDYIAENIGSSVQCATIIEAKLDEMYEELEGVDDVLLGEGKSDSK